jgi:hypothetical protein
MHTLWRFPIESTILNRKACNETYLLQGIGSIYNGHFQIKKYHEMCHFIIKFLTF